MAPQAPDRPIYDALAIPNEATANGGVEILRAGLVDDELYVAARHAFKDPAQWGEVLADITRRLALLYAMETELTEAEALTEIEEAYAAEMGAVAVEDRPPGDPPAIKAPRMRRRKITVDQEGSAAPPRRKKAAPPPEGER